MKILSEIEEGKRAKILEIPGGRTARHHLSTHGIHIGNTVLIKRRSSWGGPFRIGSHGQLGGTALVTPF